MAKTIKLLQKAAQCCSTGRPRNMRGDCDLHGNVQEVESDVHKMNGR